MSEFIDQLKARSQFFKKGHIIPTRVLRCSKRKMQHTVQFGSDVWVLPTKSGYLCLCDMTIEGASAVHLSRVVGNTNYNGSPYHIGGTHWVGNFELTDEEFEVSVRKTLEEKNAK